MMKIDLLHMYEDMKETLQHNITCYRKLRYKNKLI